MEDRRLRQDYVCCWLISTVKIREGYYETAVFPNVQNKPYEFDYGAPIYQWTALTEKDALKNHRKLYKHMLHDTRKVKNREIRRLYPPED